MNILFYCTFSNEKEWLQEIKKIFKGQKIYTIKNKTNFNDIEIAIVWNLPDKYLSKLKNLKVIFSPAAGVDHILNLPSYKNIPIIRLKDPSMAKRMSNHVLSQILNYQLKLTLFQKAQVKKIWYDEMQTLLNNKIQVGILGVGFLGTFVGRYLKKLNYNVVGFKNSSVKEKTPFPIYIKKKLDQFIKESDIIVCILPATKKTRHFINSNFLNKMKKNSLLINVGRGISINEKDLLQHLRTSRNFYASLDVFQKEPLPKSHPFWRHPNVTVTPHVASLTVISSAVKLMHKRFKDFKRNGKIKSDVNLIKGY